MSLLPPASLDFHAKVAIVTGSSAGIGQATVLLLAKGGACVTVHGNDETEFEETKKLFESAKIPRERLLFIMGNIEQKSVREALIRETVKKFGQIDILGKLFCKKPNSFAVNNVGATALKNETDNFSLDTLRYIFEVTVVCTVDMTQLAVPYLMKTKGCVVNTSSTLANRPSFIAPYYGVSKAALDMYTKAAAALYAQVGIRVNAVRVGATNTRIYAKHKMPKITDAFLKQVCHLALQHRIAEPLEIANLICFLANNEKASFITGEISGVDGGLGCSLIPPPDNFSDLIKDLPYQSNGLFPTLQ